MLGFQLLVAAAGNSAEQCHAGCRAAEYLSTPADFPRNDMPKHMPGMHVLCISAGEDDKIRIQAFKNCMEGPPPIAFSVNASVRFRKLRKRLQRQLKITKKTTDWGHYDLKQRWNLFTTTGELLDATGGVNALLEAQTVLLMEGGQFVWPGVKVGNIQSKKIGNKTLYLETLSMQPVVLSIKNFLDPEECSLIIRRAEGRMHNSGVSHMDHDRGKAAKQWRTSTQAWLHSREHAFIAAIDHRVAMLTGVPVTHQEDVQVLRYELTQHYSAHLDAWDPMYYASNKDFIDHGHRNRLATVFWYMSDVHEGGETIFPRAHGLPQPHDMWSCDSGLKVKPQEGKVIIFYSLFPNGNVDPNSLHGGCPVKEGMKWAANKWVWNKPRGA